MAHGPGTVELLRRIALGGTELDVSDLGLTSLPDLPPTLTSLYCGDNQLTVLPDLPPTLTHFNCGINKLTVLPALPPTLMHLNCDQNKLTVLPDLPPTLTSLYCGDNQLTVLPALPPTLTHLDCDDNQLTVVPDLPPTLTILKCGDNQLTVLPPLPPTLRILNCPSNQLTVLPPLPLTVHTLSCHNNQLTALPDLPPTLKNFGCGKNQLTVLPPLPLILEDLTCFQNKLTVLPALPPTLTILNCGDNQLTVLPDLPPTLTHFNCGINKLTVLPALPPKLKNFGCGKNQLTVLPPLPPTLRYLECRDNLKLSRVTFPFPPKLRDYLMRIIFYGTMLLDIRGEETLGQYEDRMSTTKWAGYSTADVELFKTFFIEGQANNISFCPVCLSYSERRDGCMYMTHICPVGKHPDLYKTYSDEAGRIGWCTICGRACKGHKHYNANLPTDKPVLNPLGDAANPFDIDCTKHGGGGVEEKMRRFERLLNYACQLQEEVGKISDIDARIELIEETWKAGIIRDRGSLKRFADKTFAFPCTFPDPPRPNAEVVFPSIPRPAGQAAPVSHPSPPAECMSELEPTATGQPVFQFIHTQPDGTVYTHPDNEWICGQHIQEALDGDLFTGLCFINPAMCKARLYPEELEGKVSPEYLAKYTRLFNEKFAAPPAGGRRRARTYRVRRKYRGGAGPSIMTKIEPDDIQCVLPQKSGRRTTRRGRKSTRSKKMSGDYNGARSLYR